jgi:Lipid A disaccharide synthetase
MRSFREQGIDVEFEGIGGPQMIAEGFHSYYPMEILSVMGIVEVLKDLKNYLLCVMVWSNAGPSIRLIYLLVLMRQILICVCPKPLKKRIYR